MRLPQAWGKPTADMVTSKLCHNSPMYYGNQPPFNNVVVTQVGPGMGAVYQAPPYDYTTQAFFACLCCFWPTGLMAIMKASESHDAAARCDMHAAHQAANSARQMIRISYVVGVVSIVFACVFIVLGSTFSS